MSQSYNFVLIWQSYNFAILSDYKSIVLYESVTLSKGGVCALNGANRYLTFRVAGKAPD